MSGFDHIRPLEVLIENPLLPVSELRSLYVNNYLLKPENAGSKEMMASFLKTNSSNFLVDDFEKFAARLNQKSSYELHLLKNNLLISENEEQDWDMDLFGLIESAGQLFPDLLLESQIFKMNYQSVLMEVARTSISLPHSGLSVACAQKIKRYGMTAAGRRLPYWRSLCQNLRKF